MNIKIMYMPNFKDKMYKFRVKATSRGGTTAFT